jgi:hypothetical protein
MEAYKRGSHTDEMWVDYIKNQTSPEPNDNFNVTKLARCPPKADQSGFEP